MKGCYVKITSSSCIFFGFVLGSIWCPVRKKIVKQEVISFMYELSVGADRIISYILYVPSNFLKAAPKWEGE